jgi:hypothetical protein
VLSIDRQNAVMQMLWPRFRVKGLNRANQSARWVGEVKPQFSRFTLEIHYSLGKYPQTRILSPELVRRPGDPEGALPHVYPPADDPRLCLFDPEAKEWTSRMAIAETIVPWALDWIACYELWLMTGTWRGGGRHAGDPPVEPAGGMAAL